ncbi:MAG TPA: hypothetical protein VK638_27170 [Edaphobacter sp.]|nr:hypothetical protein [Edaphobacter sp.]
MSNWRAIVGAASLAAIGVAIALRKKNKMTEIVQPLPPCIFCNNESGSEEHLWPDWVHKFIKKNGIDLGGLRVQEGTGPETIEYDLEKKINTVCHTCNNTWMSRIEDKNRARFLKMLENEPFTLDTGE